MRHIYVRCDRCGRFVEINELVFFEPIKICRYCSSGVKVIRR